MYSSKTLEIVGYREEHVPNTFFQNDSEASHLAMVLPGMGYTCQMPLLYYPSKLLREMGADVLWVEYAYNHRADYQALSEEAREQWLFADVTAASRTALAQRAYKEITVIGKSIGTLGMMQLLAHEWDLIEAKALWLTPLLKREQLRHVLRHHTGNSLTIIGSADPHYDAKWISEMRLAPVHQLLVVDDANHSVEVTDTLKSVEIMGQVMRRMQDFLTQRI